MNVQQSPDATAHGVTSMVAPLRSVALRRPGAILSADPDLWHYQGPLDHQVLLEQFDGFARALQEAGVDVRWLSDEADELADSIFTYDPSFMIGTGAVLLRPGKELRLGEVELHRAFYKREHIPVVGEIVSPGRVEGGDLMWLDNETLAVGRGFRTNQHGIDQLADIVGGQGVSLEVYDLPYHHGPDACLHLLSVVNPLDIDLALVHRRLVPVALLESMADRGYELIDAPPDEFDASLGLSLNVLALTPRNVMSIAGFPKTRQMMEHHGCRVVEFAADRLCLPCEGGPTCLTRPLLRR